MLLLDIEGFHKAIIVSVHKHLGGTRMLILYLSMLETTHEKSKMAELYSLHKYASLHVALSITHDQRMAEDAVHDAFIQVIKNKDKDGEALRASSEARNIATDWPMG